VTQFADGETDALRLSGRTRSWLFVPGSRPERFDKAATSGADHVILDLEDAVDSGSKEVAREHVVGWLKSGGRAWVRVNAVDTDWWNDDVAALSRCGPELLGLVIPKADAVAIEDAAGRAGRSVALVALVETARGLLDTVAVAGHSRVVAMAFGSVDYALDVAASDPGALNHARNTLVAGARAAGLTELVDGVSLDVADLEAVRRDAVQSRALGFSGKLCIHPAQVPAVHDGLAPTNDEVAWASRVLAAAADLPNEHAGAFRVDGRMVDRPVLLRAQRLVREAGALP